VTVSAVQDLINVIAGASKIIGIHSVKLGRSPRPPSPIYGCGLRYLPVTVTTAPAAVPAR